MNKSKEIINLFLRTLLYSLIVILINLVIILFFTQELSQITYWLALISILEGGLGLVAGAGAVFYSPVFSKVTEKLFNSKPWTYKRQKRTEQQAKNWIITAVLLIIEALIISAI
jgi:hypothetical protein